MPCEGNKYILDTDASMNSIGAVLSQIQDGEERVIAYASRTLSKSEKNYCVTRRELLAVVFYVKHFKAYLLGNNFLIRTDHSALQWLRKTPDPIGQQARWLEILEEYQFAIIHRPGKKHGNADAMSRRPCKQCKQTDGPQQEFQIANNAVAELEHADEEVLARTIIIGEPNNVTDSPWNVSKLAELTENDPELQYIVRMLKEHLERPSPNAISAYDSSTRAYWCQWNRLQLKDGCLYRRFWLGEDKPDLWQLIPPIEYRKVLLELCHSSLGSGHVGLRKTRAKLQTKAYWIGWQQDAYRYIRACAPCAQYKRGKPPKQGPLQTPVVGEVWARVSIDINGPHPRSRNGYRFMLTGIDSFSKWGFAIPLRHHDAVAVAGALVDKVFTVFGIPAQILSDRGPEFEGHLMHELCKMLEIEKLRTTAYKPSTNGMVERWHRTLNSLLAKVISDRQTDWDEWLPAVLCAYHASEHESTGFTPNFLMLGREIRIPLDLAFGLPEGDVDEGKPYSDLVEKKQVQMEIAFAIARETWHISFKA